MVFITHCWKNFPRPESLLLSARRRVQWACAALLMVCATVAHAETPVEMQNLKVERQDGALYLSVNWRFDMPAALEDALLKGITLHFVTEADISQERWYVYSQRVAHAERHVRLFYQPLTRRWRVNTSPQALGASGLGVSLGQSYETAEDAINAVRRIVRWRIANASDVQIDTKPSISLSFKLDLKQLPRPLQIGAEGHSDWNIGLSRAQRLELTHD